MADRDIMEYDVVVVGAGPAGLAFAIRLRQLRPDASVCVLEKAATVGAHALSGAVIEPAPLDELLPQWRQADTGICVPAGRDEFRLLTRQGSFRLPTPPQQHNAGNFIVSLGTLVAWLATQAEALGIDVFPGFAAAEALVDDDGVVRGVRIGDMGVRRDGTPGPNHTAGADIHAKLTVLAEGCRGSISRQLIERFGLGDGRAVQTYSLGFKELWQLPPGRVEPGFIQHTVGWPMDPKTYAGSFLYHIDQDRVYIGYVIGLDYADPSLEPFEAFQQFKEHPINRALLEGGELVAYGARTIASGGWQSMPKPELPGALLIGDGAGTLNVPKIKGVHLALRSGMLAAEHYAETGASDGFEQRWRNSASGAELRKVRNIKPGFHRGLWLGMANGALETVLGGRTPWTLGHHDNAASLKRLGEYTAPQRHWADARALAPRDRMAAVYLAGNVHEEDQPVHLKVADTSICAGRCVEEYGNPCERFCPAGVYEMVDDGSGGRRLQINAANCVHCKACDIKDPYRIITWVPPEGGSGPSYQNM